jgi:hypothetical protein
MRLQGINTIPNNLRKISENSSGKRECTKRANRYAPRKKVKNSIL